jgi:histidinol-phosphate phosphatase family protein
MLDLKKTDSNWILFLDRDGVINHEKFEDYIYTYDEFIFYEGVKNAMQIFSQRFGRIIIVTNQRGVGKGWMTEPALLDIHNHMSQDIEVAGGRIDAIYYCTSLDNADPNRKPQPGMALKAQKDFPEIDLRKSIMVGNNLSDMEFGRNAGMYTVFLKTTHPDQLLPHPAIDLAYDNLLKFAEALMAG